MSEVTTLVNIFNQTERRIRCIANEHDYLGDGTVFKEEELEVGREYTYIRGEAKSYGMMVHLAEVEEGHGYGFQSYLFEEVEPYDKVILKKEYSALLLSELNKGEESIKNGRTYTIDEVRKHLELMQGRCDDESYIGVCQQNAEETE